MHTRTRRSLGRGHRLATWILILLQSALFLSCAAHGDRKHTGGKTSPSSGNRAAAVSAFELSQLVPQQDGRFKSKLFFAEGKPVCNTKTANEVAGACVIDGEYSDRIFFRFKLSPNINASEIKPPTVSAKGNAKLQPEVIKFIVAKSDSSGSFAVLYKCTKANTTASLLLAMQITADTGAEVSWQKVCGGGKNKHLTMKSEDLVNKGSSSGALFEAGPMQTSTEIGVSVNFPQLALAFQTPYLVSKSPFIDVKLRDTLTDGTLSVRNKKFRVIYDCQKKTRGKVTLTLGIPPWNNATMSWIKDCGGERPDKLVVTAGKLPVVSATGVAPAFNVTDTTTLREAVKGRIHGLGVSETSIDFLITNDDTVQYHIQGAATTVMNPDVVAVVSRKRWWSVFGRRYLETDKELVLDPKSYTHMKVDMVCLARGSSVVLVTLPILMYRSVEFGFYKECERPHVFHHSGFLRTAGSLELLLAVAVCVAALCCYRVYRQRQERAAAAKYEQVPQAAAA